MFNDPPQLSREAKIKDVLYLTHVAWFAPIG